MSITKEKTFALQLRGIGKYLRIDKSDAALQVHDYRGQIFTAENVPPSLAGFVLDRTAFDSLLKLIKQGHKISFRNAVFYQTDFGNLTISGLDFSHAKFTQCSFYHSKFIDCNLKWATINSDCNGVLFEHCSVAHTNFTGARNLTGEQIINNKGVMDAKFIDFERLLKEAEQQKHQASKKRRFSNLFGDNERHYSPRPMPLTKPVVAKSFIEQIKQERTAGLSDQAQAANRLFKHIAEAGKDNFARRIQRERAAASTALKNR